MKALLIVGGDFHVVRYVLDGGQEGEPASASSPTFHLSTWLRNGWKLDYVTYSGENGGTSIVLRDGKPIDKWPT